MSDPDAFVTMRLSPDRRQGGRTTQPPPVFASPVAHDDSIVSNSYGGGAGALATPVRYDPAVLQASTAAADTANALLRGDVQRLQLMISEKDKHLRELEATNAGLTARLVNQTSLHDETNRHLVQTAERLKRELHSMQEEQANATRLRQEEASASRSLEQEQHHLVVENEKLKAALRRKTDDIAKLDAVATQRAKDLASVTVQKVKLEQQAAKAQSEILMLRQQAKRAGDEAEAQVKQLTLQLNHTADAFRSQQELLAVAETKVVVKEREAALQAQANAAKDNELAAKTSAVERLDAALKDLQGKFATVEQSRDQRLADALKSSDEKGFQLRHALADQAAQFSAQAGQQVDKINELTGLAEGLKADLDRTARGLTEAQHLAARLQTENESLIARLKISQQDIEKRDATIAQMQRSAFMSESDLKSEAARASAYEQAKGVTIATLGNLHDDMRQLSTSLAEAKKELVVLKTKLALEEQENQRRGSELAVREKELSDVNNMYQLATASLKPMQDVISRLEVDRSALVRDKERQQQQLMDFSRLFAVTGTRMAQFLLTQEADERSLVEQLQSAVARAAYGELILRPQAERLRESEATARRLRRDLQAYQQQVEEKQAAVDTYAQQVTKLRSQTRTLEEHHVPYLAETRPALVKALLELHAKSRATRRRLRAMFSLSSWKMLVARRAVPDDFGQSLCDVVDDVQWLCERDKWIVATFLLDEERAANIDVGAEAFASPSANSPPRD